MAKSLNYRSLLLVAIFVTLLGAGAFGGDMLLSRPRIEMNKIALTFDPISLGGVVEVTVHGRGTFQILNITLTGLNRNTDMNNNLHLEHIDIPFTVQLPVKMSLSVFDHHYLPPVPSTVTVTIQGTWTHYELSFPVTISQTASLKWCASYATPQPYPYCWT
jgi:hypothetical protein